MNREQVKGFIEETYAVEGDTPWMDSPQSMVFRHPHSKKWFALAMQLPGKRLGMEGEGEIQVLNLKCHPELIGSLWGQDGFYPAYHMNKNHWITIALDGRVDDDEIKWLIGISYDLTRGKG